MNACRRVRGLILLSGPAQRATQRDDPPGAVPVHPLPVRAAEDRPVEAFTDREIDRPRGARGERDGDQLAALTQHGQPADCAESAKEGTARRIRIVPTSQQGSRYPTADRASGRHNHEVGTIVDRGSDSGEEVEARIGSYIRSSQCRIDSSNGQSPVV
jgi:hypothetical protein